MAGRRVLLWAPRQAVVERRIDQITQVQSARVSRDWPDKVVILVQDRVPALAVAAGGRFALVDEFGVIVQWAGARPPGMPLLRSPGVPATSLRGSAAVRAAVALIHNKPVKFTQRAARTIDFPIKLVTKATLNKQHGS